MLHKRVPLTEGGFRGGPSGLASMLNVCRSVDEWRALTPMPKDAQEMIDNAVVSVGLDRLVITADVLAAGLTFNLPNPLSVMELYWEKESKVGHAKRTMLPDARGEDQVADRAGVRVPIYATTEEFSLNVRTLLASERVGAPLDTSGIQQSTRRVNEAIEDAFINGAGLTVAGNSTPGLLTAPGKNTITFESNDPWDDAAKTGEDILTDVQAMIKAAHAKRQFGPYNLYVPTDYGVQLGNDFKANGDRTIRNRLLDLEGLQQIRTADLLPDDTVVLVQMNTETVDVIDGQRPTAVSWTDGPAWNYHYVVLAFLIPRVKETYTGQSGIVVGTPT